MDFGMGDEEHIIGFFGISLGLDFNLFDYIFIGCWVCFGEYFLFFLAGDELYLNRTIENSYLEFYLLVGVDP